jgi:hypothetical protein
VHNRLFVVTCVFAVALLPCSSPLCGQTDFAISPLGSFTPAPSGNGFAQTSANQGGAIFEVQHFVTPHIGYEETFSFNRANQTYLEDPKCVPDERTPFCTPPISISNNAYEIAESVIFAFRPARLRPFVLAGGGLRVDIPTRGTPFLTTCITSSWPCPTQTVIVQTKISAQPVFVYGAGLDYGFLPRVGLRLQYRGTLYESPNLTQHYVDSISSITHTAEPMIGIYFRFTHDRKESRRRVQANR